MKRYIYYPLLLGVLGLLAALPVINEPKGGWGMAGLALPFFWGGLCGAFLLGFGIYEMRHPPAEPIHYRRWGWFAGVVTTAVALSVSLNLGITLRYASVEPTSLLMIVAMLGGSRLTVPVAIVFVLLVFTAFRRIARHDQRFYRFLPWVLTLSVIIVTANCYAFMQRRAGLSKLVRTNALQATVDAGDYDGCIKLTHPNTCLRRMAEKHRDESYCLRLPISLRPECIMDVASQRRDAALCPLYRTSWAEANPTPVRGREVLDCERGVVRFQMKDRFAGQSDEQIAAAAVAEVNMDVCMAIAHMEHSSDCELAVVKVTPDGNVGLCEKMREFNAIEQIAECYRFFNVKPPSSR